MEQQKSSRGMTSPVSSRHERRTRQERILPWQVLRDGWDRKTVRAGAVYAVSVSLVLGMLVVLDLQLPGLRRLAIYKGAVIVFTVLYLIVFSLYRVGSGNPRYRRFLISLHFSDLLLVAALVNAVPVLAHRIYGTTFHTMGLSSAVTGAVLLTAFFNYLFSEGLRRWYVLHTALPVGIAAIIMFLTFDHTASRIMEHTFVGIAVVSLSILAVVQDREFRRAYVARRRVEELSRYTDALFRLAPDALFVCGTDGERGTPGITSCRRNDGTTIPVEVSRQELSIGGVAMLLFAVRDIGERIRSLETIRVLTKAVEHSPAAIVVTDADGTIEYVNQAFVDMTGYAPDEVIGGNPRILKSGRQDDEYYRTMWNTISSGTTWHGEFCNRTRSGSIYWESAAIAPIYGETADIERVARRIIARAGEPISVGNSSVTVGISIGIAIHPHDGTTWAEIVQAADAAMYDAKNAGRERYRFARRAP